MGFSSIPFFSVKDGQRWTSQLGDRLGFTLRRPVWKGEQVSFALQPAVTFPVRGGAGAAAYNLNGIGVYARGPHTLIGNRQAGISRDDETKAALGMVSSAGYYGRRLASAGSLQRFTAFGELYVERWYDSSQTTAVLGEISFDVSARYVLDVALIEEIATPLGGNCKLLTGVTLNLGNVRDWFRSQARR